MTTVTYRAWLDNTPGVARRDATGRVYFAPDESGRWQELCDGDIPRLHLCGRLDLALAQRAADGHGYAWVEARNCEQARREVAP
jgi:hypothetical protein